MPTETVMNIFRIIQEVLNGMVTRENTVIKLLKFDTSVKNIYKFAKAIAELIKKLSRVLLTEISNKIELCSRFVDPFLSGLFDDPDQDIFLRWTNETTSEAKNEQSLLSWRPGLCVTRFPGVTWISSLSFEESKPACQESNLYVICRDLLRVAMFCKDSLDSQKMVGVLGLQIAGRTITFYVLVLPSSGLYIMYEITKVQIPDTLLDI